ncbi:MAG: zinc ABC transporter substrate-binding protein [Spirochaetales bacterium]|nr:zinc ABC transporter substrate-binding protein [Spirochaetales bacterium]
MRTPRRLSPAQVLAIALLLGAAVPSAAFAGGRQQGEEPAAAAAPASSVAPAVYVSILPQVQFVERIGGDRVRVEVLVQPGQSPHSFEPTPRQMAGLADAHVYFRIGVEFENTLIPRVESTMRDLEVVDLREGIRLREIEAEDHEGAEEHEDGHAHSGLDPHTWMDPRNVVIMAATIRDTLIRHDPQGREIYEQGYDRYSAELEDLHRRIRATLAPFRGEPLFVYHPAFGYFSDAYGLEQVAVETGGTEPSARQLARLIESARAQGVRVLFVQPQFSTVSAEAVARAIGGAVVPIDALARDYLANLERVAAAVEEALRE